MELSITTTGISSHASAPELGVNAIYKMAKILQEIEKLNARLRDHEFLGKGTIAATYIDCKTAALNAVPEQCYIHIDRRLTVGETKDSVVEELQDAVRRVGVEADVAVLKYKNPSYTGLVYSVEKCSSGWFLEEDHITIQSGVETYETLFDEKAGEVERWNFSTNAVSIAGKYGIPCVGFGPAKEEHAHTINEQVRVEQLIQSAAFYAAFPIIYMKQKKSRV